MNFKYNFKTLTLLAAIACLGACSESYPGIEYDVTQGGVGGGMVNEDETSSRTPIMLFANQQNFFTITSGGTRGTGPFSSSTIENKLNGATFYVYAFRFGNYSSAPTSELTQPTDFSRYYYATNAPGSARKDIEGNAHCLLDGRDYWKGTPTRLFYGGNGELNFKEGNGDLSNEFGQTFTEGDEEHAFYYSSLYENIPFDFFGYYTDDIDLSSHHRDNDSIWYDITLDGMNDVLCGYAPRLTEDVLRNNYSGRYAKMTRAEINKVCNEIGGYSTYTAQLGIHPYMDMQHQLTQIEFLAYPADRTANDIVITGVDIYSQTTGRLVVASRNPNQVGFHPTGGQNKLQLHEASDGSGTPPLMNERPLQYDISKDGPNNSWLDQDSVRLGGSFMLMPQDSYKMVFHYRQRLQKNYTGVIEYEDRNFEPTYTLDLKEKQKDGTYRFQPGMLYTVRIAVFGVRKIEVWTHMQGWQQADGKIDIIDEWQDDE